MPCLTLPYLTSQEDGNEEYLGYVANVTKEVVDNLRITARTAYVAGSPGGRSAACEHHAIVFGAANL